MSERLPPEKVPQVRPEYPIVRPDVRPYIGLRVVEGRLNRYVSHVASLIALLVLVWWNPAWVVWALFVLIEVRILLADLALLVWRSNGEGNPRDP